MLYVSLIVEILRTRPRLVFWLAALTQAALWTLVPALFYAAPPGDLPEVLAIGHEFRLGTDFGPPLAYWLAEFAFRIGGGHLTGVYLLSQICVVITYWAVFTLGSAIVGERHAAMAVMLMAGVSALTVPTVDFGPAIAAMPLWALSLLFYWRAVGENNRTYWFSLSIVIGLLLMTTYMGLLLVALLLLFTVATERGRAHFGTLHPWFAGFIVVAVMFPHLIWLDQATDTVLPRLTRLNSAEAFDNNLTTWLRLAFSVLVGHAGLGILVALASNLFLPKHGTAPAIERPPIGTFARNFVYYFALMPAFVATLFVVVIGQTAPAHVSPLVILSGLAVIVAGGDSIRLHHQRIATFAWAGLLLVPPAITAAAVVLLPWTFAIDIKIAQPANDLGRFFTESFERRTGRPFTVVTGDKYLSALVAIASPRRPRLYRDLSTQRTAWVSRDELVRNGGVVVWPATDTAGTPPANIKEQFPDLVPELPRSFARTFQGRMPLLRIGWGVIRPQADAAPAPPR
jgi:hypothetical protein